MNKWVISGNLGQDPEIRYSQSGVAICNLSVGCKRYAGKDSSGAAQYKTDWFRVTVFNKLAELCGNNLSKGKKITAIGNAQNEEWEKDGVKHKNTILKADEVEWDKSGQVQNSTQANSQPASDYDVNSFGQDVFPGDEIPF